MEKEKIEEHKNTHDLEIEIDGYENDPDVLALKAEIDAAKTVSHKREKTMDLEKRLELQIAEMASNIPEKTGEGKALIEADPELLSFYKDIDTKYKTEIEDMWGEFVEDTEAEKIEHSTDFSQVHNAIMSNPFLQKIIKSTESQVSMVSFIKDTYTLPNCLLYDLLVERLNIHSACVPDYTLKRMLAENEPFLKSK